MSMPTPRNKRLTQTSQESVPATGDAELARYARVLSEYKIEITVLQEIIEQHRARRRAGWGQGKDTPTP